ncbi:hypothetical protein D9M69_575130 [compost metagenome]
MLEVLQPVACRRCGDMRGRSAAGETLCIGDRLEQAQVGQFVTQGSSGCLKWSGESRIVTVRWHSSAAPHAPPPRRPANHSCGHRPLCLLRYCGRRTQKRCTRCRIPEAIVPTMARFFLAAPPGRPSLQELSCKYSPISFLKAVAMKLSSSTRRPLAPRSICG